MNDDISEDIYYVDADTSLADLDISRLQSINVDVNTGNISGNSNDEPSLFAANNLLRKTSDNLARAEAMTDENPLWTEKTAEIERKEAEDSSE